MLNNANAPAYKDASSDMKEYMSYIVNTYLMKTTGILDADKVDTKDATYVDWTKNEVINVHVLNYAISKGWIDVSGESGYQVSEFPGGVYHAGGCHR